MKKTSSFSLEKDIYNEIDSYRAKYDLSSRNVALERMLLERRMLLNINSIEQVPITNIEKVVNNNSDDNTNEEDESFKNIIKDSFNNMPD